MNIQHNIKDPVRSIIVLRSSDLNHTTASLELLSKLFCSAKIYLICQEAVVHFFKGQFPGIGVIPYPHKDFHVFHIPKEFVLELPNADLVVGLFGGPSSEYNNIKIFLKRITANNHACIDEKGSLHSLDLPIWGYYRMLISEYFNSLGGTSMSAARSWFYSQSLCRGQSLLVLHRQSTLKKSDSARLAIKKDKVIQVGLISPKWNAVWDLPARISIQENAECYFNGNINIFGGVKINVFPGAKLTIGEGTYIGYESKIYAEKMIEIGSNCAISWDVQIIDSDFHSLRFSPSFDQLYRKGISIGDNVWIGCRSLIMKGVRIGSHAVIGAGSVITRNVPDNTIVAGNPAIKLDNLKELPRV